jgi:hypothetical protein
LHFAGGESSSPPEAAADRRIAIPSPAPSLLIRPDPKAVLDVFGKEWKITAAGPAKLPSGPNGAG